MNDSSPDRRRKQGMWFQNVGWAIAAGVLLLNLALYWASVGLRLSMDILVTALPVVVLAVIGLVVCSIVIGDQGTRLTRLSAIALLGYHFAILGYLLHAMVTWREGTEFARLMVVQEVYVAALVCVFVVRPLFLFGHPHRAAHQ